MEASAALVVLFVTAFLVGLFITLGYHGVRLRRANQRLSGLYETFQDHRNLILCHLERLEQQLQELTDRPLVWDPHDQVWRLKGQIRTEGLVAYLAWCRSFAQERFGCGEDRKRVDAIIGVTLKYLTQDDSHCQEQLCRLLTDEERARWLRRPCDGLEDYSW